MKPDKKILIQLVKRIEEIIEDKTGGNKTKFAKELNITPGNFSKSISRKSVGIELIRKISIKFDVNINWIMTGEGFKYLNRNRYMGRLENWVDEQNRKDPRAENYLEMRIEELFPKFKDWMKEKKKEK